MKNNISGILAAVSCLLAVVCLTQIFSLKSQVSMLENNLANRISDVNNGIGNISSNISYELDKQTSLLSDSSWEFGKINTNSMTVALRCNVTPKEYSVGTEAFIVLNGAEYPMVHEGSGVFTLNTDIPLFSETNVSMVMFREGETMRTEKLDWYLSPKYSCLLDVYAQIDGSSTSRGAQNGILTLSHDGIIRVQSYNGDIKSATLVEMLDGEKLSTTEISLDNKAFFENYQNESGARPEMVETMTSDGSPTTGPFFHALKKDYEIPFGSEFTLYVDVEDENNLVNRCMIYYLKVSENGEPDFGYDYYQWMNQPVRIYDKNGKLLYDAIKENNQ